MSSESISMISIKSASVAEETEHRNTCTVLFRLIICWKSLLPDLFLFFLNSTFLADGVILTSAQTSKNSRCMVGCGSHGNSGEKQIGDGGRR